ncbi:MAG: hypothetical protein V3W09_03525, partial [Nitrososphaerales archaeon]
EIFPESWNIDVDNWSRKRYCPICKLTLTGTYNCFKNHSQDIHDDWADIIQPWIRWKGLRNKNNELTE